MKDTIRCAIGNWPARWQGDRGRVRAQPWQEAYLFLKHDEESTAGPEAAVRLAAIVSKADTLSP